MSKYTTEVRFICETSCGMDHSEGYKSVNTIIDESLDKIFDFDFPIFDENYRKVLEHKILKHYYTREICCETVGLWKHFLDMKLNEIMPYYNKLYASELLEFDPLYDVDLTKDHRTDGHKNASINRETNGNDTNKVTSQDSGSNSFVHNSEEGGTQHSNGTTQDSGTQGDSGTDAIKNTRWDTYSDTPQGALTGVINENYLTNARKIVDDGTGTTHSSTTTFGKKVENNDSTNFGKTVNVTGTDTFGRKNVTDGESEFTNTQTGTDDIFTTEDYLEHVKGKSGGVSFSEMLLKYRETFINIDLMIIRELKDLFMGLW